MEKTFFKVLLIIRGDACVAQMLEHDIAAQGRNVDEAKLAFERVFAAQIDYDRKRNREPFAHLPKAPDRYWQAWDAAANGRKLEAEPIHAPVDSPRFMVPVFSQDSAA